MNEWIYSQKQEINETTKSFLSRGLSIPGEIELYCIEFSFF